MLVEIWNQINSKDIEDSQGYPDTWKISHTHPSTCGILKDLQARTSRIGRIHLH